MSRLKCLYLSLDTLTMTLDADVVRQSLSLHVGLVKDRSSATLRSLRPAGRHETDIHTPTTRISVGQCRK